MLSLRVGDLWNDSDEILGTIGIATSFAAGTGDEGPAQDEEAMLANLDDAGSAGFRFEDASFDPMLLNRAEIELLQSLNARRKEIEKREREFDLREKTLAAAESSLVEKIDELRNLKVKVEALLTQHDEAQEGRLRSLVKIYESMKPKDAARILASLDGEILLDVIERMREAKTAPILALLNSDKAQRITVQLMQRNRFKEDANR
jgi:flagellar motility protein MotE (MotC chaperone)